MLAQIFCTSVYMSPTIIVNLIYLNFSIYSYLLFNCPIYIYMCVCVCLSVCVCQVCSTFYVVRPMSTKFGLHAGDIKFNTQNEE
jgi:hypothetical protein